MAADKARAIEAGCSEYETKPIDFPALLAKIYQFLEGADS
jgi:CheY-like chemotaxis protein